MQALFESMRQASLPAVWSQGVKLARAHAVSEAERLPSAITLRVQARGHAIAPTVTLYTEDGEWTCDCGGPTDPCMHAVAAAIAAKEGLTQAAAPDAPAAAAASARLVYRLGTRANNLTVNRVIVHADGREEAVNALASLVAAGKVPRGIVPTHDDLAIDRLLSAHRQAL